jgi:hypothetical protein
MSDPGVWEKIIKAFEQYPGYLLALIVIYIMYKIIKELMLISKGDTERMSKLITLLEILVHKRED